MPRVVTLTTDFGVGSIYVAQLKARLLHAVEPFVVVDIAHGVRAHDVRAAAWLVAQTCTAFPPGSLHLVVVDPGVGTPRRLIWARLGSGDDDQDFLCPDNGVLSLVLDRMPLVSVREIVVPDHASATFHGRDVLAPAAVRILDGAAPASLGPPCPPPMSLDSPKPIETDAGLLGEVTHVDDFGNLVTNFSSRFWPRLKAAGRLRIGEHDVARLVRTYGDAPPGASVALVGSQGWIEAAVVEGRADTRFAAAVGTPVLVPVS